MNRFLLSSNSEIFLYGFLWQLSSLLFFCYLKVVWHLQTPRLTMKPGFNMFIDSTHTNIRKWWLCSKNYKKWNLKININLQMRLHYKMHITKIKTNKQTNTRKKRFQSNFHTNSISSGTLTFDHKVLFVCENTLGRCFWRFFCTIFNWNILLSSVVFIHTHSHRIIYWCFCIHSICDLFRLLY